MASIDDCVYVDVLVSITPSLIAPTIVIFMRVCGSYLYLLKYQTEDEAVGARENFEAYMESHSVYNKNYHVDNIIFLIPRCMNHCKDTHGVLNFDIVNAHHQTG